MRWLILLFLSACAFGQTQIAVGTINHVRYADQYPGSDACAKISNAMTALPSTGGVVDARGFLQTPQTCSTNPFAANPLKPVQVLLCGTFTTTAMWTLEEGQTVVGCGRDNAILRASPSFNFSTSKAMARIGSTAAVESARFENLRVDCNNVSNGVGFYSTWAQEQAGLVHATAVKCEAFGIWWEGNSANNSYMEDVEVLNPTGSGATTIPILIDDVKGFRGINGITVNNNGTSPNPTNCIKLNNATTGVFNGMHMEYCGDGIDLGSSTGVAGVVISQIFPSNTVTTVVKINGPDTPANSVVLQAINRGSATNTVNDVENSIAITDALVPLYIAGAGQTSYFAGNAIQGSAITTTSQTTNVLTLLEGFLGVGTSNASVLQADSVTHTLEASYSGDSFRPLTRTIGTGSLTTPGTAVTNGTCQAQTGITVTGALTSDNVMVNLAAAPPATWQTGIQSSAHVTATNTVTIYLCNPSAGSITPAATALHVMVVR